MAPGISENSKRVAINTLLLYGRMLLLLLIGLFTSRVILRTLGVEDFGVYNAVGGVTAVFTFISASVSSAISRFITVELGKEHGRIKQVFAASVAVMAILAILFVIFAETAGLWFLRARMNIPQGREGAAEFVLHCSVGMGIFSLLALPYNSLIIAHEKMGAFAAISLVEAFLKLAAVLALLFFEYDKLKVYAIIMLTISIIVRTAYASFCRHHFPESHFDRKVLPDRHLFKDMFGFAGWTFFGSSAYVVNTQGLNLLINIFFGVTANAARGIAVQVEGIVRQFMVNVLTAVNPQITKSFSSGNRQYCFELSMKGARYVLLISLALFIPIAAETEPLLRLWLGTVPDNSAVFVRLVISGTIVDLAFNTLVTVIQADGKIKNYYLLFGAIAYLALPISWLLFRMGLPSYSAFVVVAAIYAIVDVLRLFYLKNRVDFPVSEFLREVILKIGAVAVLSGILTFTAKYLLRDTCDIVKIIGVTLVSLMVLVGCSWFIVLTAGEKDFIKGKICKRKR